MEQIRKIHGNSGRLAPKIIVFITPQERARIADIRAGEFAGYLTRPVRRVSLLRLLDPSGFEDISQPDDLASVVGKIASSPQMIEATDLNVLVAEDNPINWMLVRALLGKLGHKAELAEDGHKAVSLTAQGAYDVVLMDLHMPGLDGLEAITKIRGADDEATAKVPIYVVSADVMPEAKEEALRAGANGFLSKPLKKQDLEAILRKYAKS